MENPFRPGLRYLADSGLATTTLATRDGRDPPAAAYAVVEDEHARATLRASAREHAAIAAAHGLGLVLETPTLRASPDWGEAAGHDRAALERINRAAVALLRETAAGFPDLPLIVSGQIGPRADAYVPGAAMDIDEAAGYHSQQIRALAGADMVIAAQMTNAAEASGIVLAADILGVPAAVSFAVTPGGRLPSGQPLAEAVEETDKETDGVAILVMVECVDPDHAADALSGPVAGRIGGMRAGGFSLPRGAPAAGEADGGGEPDVVACRVAALARALPSLRVFAGPRGAGALHAAAIAAAVSRVSERAG